MADQELAQQVQQAWNMSADDLYKQLGMASLGTSNFTESIDSMNLLMSVASNTDAHLATKSLGDNLLNKGKVVFTQTWNSIKDLVCTIYNEKILLEGKDLATYIIAAIIAAGRLVNALATLIVTLAVKKGLTKMCAI